MSSRLNAWVAGLVLSTAMSGASALTFSTFVSTADLVAGEGNTQAIGFAYAGDRFVGSVYTGTNNNQLYQVGLTGGAVTTFGAPIAGASGEIYVSSSLGLGLFGLRQVFAGAQNQSAIFRFDQNGANQTLFVSGLVGGIRSIAFDPFGLYGFDMIVATTAGNIYRVSGAGVATLLANVGEDAEGLSFAPQAFGPFPKGTLVVASEASGSLRAIAPNGTKTLVTTIGSAEMVSFVPTNLGASGDPVEGFYAASFPCCGVKPDAVIKADASQFTSFLGDMIVTGETTHQVWDVHFNGSTFVSTLLGSFPNNGQPEDGIFVTAAIINPGCDQTNTCTRVPEPAPLALIAVGLAAFAFRRRLPSRA